MKFMKEKFSFSIISEHLHFYYSNYQTYLLFLVEHGTATFWIPDDGNVSEDPNLKLINRSLCTDVFQPKSWVL